MPNDNFEALVAKLREVFQIDRTELDFGVYRILNARAGEVNAYLTTRLKERVAEALATGAAANVEGQQKELANAIKAAEGLGVDPETTAKVKDLRAAIKAATSGASEHENAVYSHLLQFFSRYYDKGDFISQRRYKGDTYAIPYAGEEVVLHWANKDQYYTKSGEAFSNFAFTLEDGRSVQFRLVAADTAKDNRKDNDKARCFVLAEARTIKRVDDEGEAFEEHIAPITEDGDTLILRFDYKAMPKGTKQDAQVEAAVQTVLTDEAVAARWQALTTKVPTDKKPDRTLLEKHLKHYTEKNSSDYFIHKDLGTFLRRELDFYIKNEVMNLDDVQDIGTFSAIEKNLRMIQTLRAIALDLITFLASIEDFQKKLWLKKKFVVAAHWCITLDLVPEALYPAIAANPAQWAQWHDLGMRDDAMPGDVAALKASPYLMVDTALFDGAFRADLLRAIPDLDAQMDGLLVHGDNFQALTLLRERYREKVKCVYIDPPYNSPSSEIAYKNYFKHSSWLTLIENRVRAAVPLQPADGGLVVAIDKHEQNGLVRILSDGHADKSVVQVTIEHNKKGVQGDGFSFNHEYAVFVIPEKFKTRRKELPEEDWEWANLRNWGGESERADAANCFYPIFVKGKEIVGFGPVCPDDFNPESANVVQPDGSIAIYPIDQEAVERKWRYERGTVEGIIDLLKVTVAQDKKTLQVMKAKNSDQFKTSWYSSIYNAGDHGTAVLTKMGFRKDLFDNPKSIFTVADCITAICPPNELVMDFFAGSGTTAHSVIKLRRDQDEKRDYALIEQGPYFDTVIKPRIQKVVFSADWDKGKPTAPDTGISHAFKTLKIESYEDALNNLMLAQTPEQAALIDKMGAEAKDAYLMRYMLDVEAKGSLLSVEDFKKPFDYALNIAVDSAGAYTRQNVDLIETFNYLIGLTVTHIDMRLDADFALVKGTLPSGEHAAILWRDCEAVGYEALNALCEQLAIEPGKCLYDVVYVNGDHTIPSKAEVDGVTKSITLRQIEPAFLEAMFSMDDA